MLDPTHHCQVCVVYIDSLTRVLCLLEYLPYFGTLNVEDGGTLRAITTAREL